jgi:hypothetical protein
MSKLDLVFVYRDRSASSHASSRALLSAELPELWRRMTQPGAAA